MGWGWKGGKKKKHDKDPKDPWVLDLIKGDTECM